jgi:fructose-1,6-bisphosphatase/inositol monophosphatase family enzyme
MPDIALVSGLIRDVAAEFVLPRFEHLAEGDIREKAPGDYVTIADLEAEQALTPRLMALVPGSVVVGEEATAKDTSILDRIATEDAVWTLDPVDGTANFASGMPLFAVMIAFLRAGRPVASWIYDPVKDQMAVAERGAGAWSEGRRLSVAGTAAPENMSGSVSTKFGNRQLVRKIAGRSNLVGSVFSFRCAGHEYLALAAGRAHFALYHRLMPWDHAPGYLLHREAGGYGKRLDRTDYTPTIHDGGLLLTPDAESWESLHALLIA